jgi:hypothetical protein
LFSFALIQFFGPATCKDVETRRQTLEHGKTGMPAPQKKPVTLCVTG